ncbi:MAG: hypothetical protein VCF07_08440 [Nitrospinota bacterium]
MAIILENRRTGSQNTHYLGAKIADRQIVGICRRKIILAGPDGPEFLRLYTLPAPNAQPGPGGGTGGSVFTMADAVQQTAPGRWKIAGKHRKQIYEKMRAGLEKATIKPVTGSWGHPGLRIEGISEHSPLDLLGLKNGDVVRRVNRFRLEGEEDLVHLRYQFANANHIQVVIEREGWPRVLYYLVDRND